MKRFVGRVAVITGAASGFGREFARAGARLGMRLVLADVDVNALDVLATELRSSNVEVIAQRCDVRRSNDVQLLADAAMSRFGEVHLIFNNAGVAFGGLIWESSEADWEWVLGVNLWGVIHGVRIFTPLMLDAARRDPDYEGHIVNTASMAGLVNAPAMSAYNISKQAVVSVSETLHHDLALVGAPIGTSVLCPYFVPTGIAESDRNRPGELQTAVLPTASQVATQALMRKAVSSGKLSAEQIARRTFDAISENRFYVYSHPGDMDAVRMRMEDMLTGRNPTDPYLAVPHIRDVLLAAVNPK